MAPRPDGTSKSPMVHVPADIRETQTGGKGPRMAVFSGDHGLPAVNLYTKAGAKAGGAKAGEKEGSADFVWTDYAEPHAERKRLILKKYGKKVTKLMGPSWKTKYLVLVAVSIQLFAAYLLRDKAWTTWEFYVTAYVVGATVTQNLFLAIHEITHNLAFKDYRLNKLLAMFANFPILVPYSAKFPGYHLEHHRYQGVDHIDTDIPHPAEAWLFHNTGMLGKVFFAFFQICFYALRPTFVRQQLVDKWFIANVLQMGAFGWAIFHHFGMGPIWYLLFSDLLAGSIHPLASHFIAEHYVFLGEYETYSYYGWLNVLCYNVGYHNEHHDFPNIAWDKLPELRRVAADFYEDLPYHRSWPLVLWKFITSDNISAYARVKRPDTSNLAAAPIGARRVRGAASKAKSPSNSPRKVRSKTPKRN